MTVRAWLNFLFEFFFSANIDSTFNSIVGVLTTVGLVGIFRKCGISWWKALIPMVRESNLGKAADRAQEGRVLAVIQAIELILSLIGMFLPKNPDTAGRLLNMFEVLTLVTTIISIVYMIRVYLGLTGVFGLRRRWILLWIFFSPIPAMCWGWMKKYQPQWTVKELESDASTFFSGSKAQVMDQGLTVNLEERTAREFFQKKTLLRDIHMYIQPGHMVLLLGGSGAGKTTFLNAVNGYEKAKAEVMLNGRNMYSEYKDMKYDIGFVPQQDLMRGSDSVYRTLMDAAALRLPKNFSRAERAARVEDVMNVFGLKPVMNNLVSKLSGGQRKRLSIAMEFISNPSLFILDEPDSGLDGVMARELFQQLRLIADQGKIIIVITHTPDRVIDLFDDVIVLAKDAARTGRLAFYGSIEEARTFFGREKMEEIVKSVNREEEGGEGRADEFILKYAEVQHV